MTLDRLASQAVLQARLLERAVHDPGPWTMVCGSQRIIARRFLTETGITFLGDFPRGLTESLVTLECAGQPMTVREVETTASMEAVTIRWDVLAGLVDSPRP